jgi:hypothetical protein
MDSLAVYLLPPIYENALAKLNAFLFPLCSCFRSGH